MEGTHDFLLKAVPAGVVGMWASIGVVAVVILVRLRDGDFGFRVGAGLFVIGGAAVVMMCSQLRPSRTTPDDEHVGVVVAKAKAYRGHGATLQVRGFVVDGSVLKRGGAEDYRFQLALERGGVSVLSARYAGPIPDSLRSGAEIVAKGTVAEDGWLEVAPDGILTKRVTD